MPVFRDSFSTNRTVENGLTDGKGAFALAFLWAAHEQSGFEKGHKANAMRSEVGIQPRRFNFVGILESDSDASHKPVYEDSTHLLSLAKSR